MASPRRTNNLGGFEGGMTNGQPIVVRGVMKPIPTLYKPLMSVDIETHEPYKATVERSDPTALPAAGVVMESVVATVLATEILEKFSSDNLEELKDAVAPPSGICQELLEVRRRAWRENGLYRWSGTDWSFLWLWASGETIPMLKFLVIIEVRNRAGLP